MKRLLRHFVVDTVSLYLISQNISGMTFSRGLTTLLVTGVVLSLTTLLIKPLINILLLPINLITFGLFKWVAYVITLYLVTLVVADFKIIGFHFGGFSTPWFTLPEINLPGFLALIGFSFLISSFSSIMLWIMK